MILRTMVEAITTVAEETEGMAMVAITAMVAATTMTEATEEIAATAVVTVGGDMAETEATVATGTSESGWPLTPKG